MQILTRLDAATTALSAVSSMLASATAAYGISSEAAAAGCLVVLGLFSSSSSWHATAALLPLKGREPAEHLGALALRSLSY